MKPLTIIYWSRLALGIVAAVISAFVATMQNATSLSAFMNGVTIALIVYLTTYYAFKAKFYNKVEKQTKIMTMGIGIYFMSWLVFFILTYSIMSGRL
ncbi:MAG: hypothetical protein NWF09_00865 [Candidatus Bathyarchaeota archaeon]|nr:hypothetical protein [Candidatus Bathyarchaeota archaeon]